MSKYQRSYKSISGRKRYRPSKNRAFSVFLLRVGRRHIKALLLSVLLVSMTGGVFYFLFISDKFAIGQVNVSGLKAIRETEVRRVVDDILEQKRFGFLESTNYFLFPSDMLQTTLAAAFPRIGNAKVQKLQHNTVDIIIEERDAIGVWCLASRDLAKPDGPDGCFYFDKKGVIFVQAPKSFGSLMIGIRDERDTEASVGNAVLSSAQVAFAGAAQGLVSRNFPFSIRTFVITRDGEYEILTSEGWRVLLDKSAEAEYQLSNLKYVLDEEIETRRQELEYVDLRLGNRVYYKYKGSVDGL